MFMQGKSILAYVSVSIFILHYPIVTWNPTYPLVNNVKATENLAVRKLGD